MNIKFEDGYIKFDDVSETYVSFDKESGEIQISQIDNSYVVLTKEMLCSIFKVINGGKI